MKNIIKNLIFTLCLIISCQGAFGYVLTYEQLNNYLEKQITSEIKQSISQYSNDYKININGIIRENIITNELNPPKIEIISQDNTFKPNLYKRIVIKDSTNKIIKSFPINVQTSIYKNVLVAIDVISYNKEINSNNTKIEKREISKYLGKTIDSLGQNQIANRNYPKGSIILTSYLKEKSSVLKNSTVDIVFKSSKGLNIKLQGKALSEGAIGDTILVRSEKYNKTYNAKVDSPNQVTVRI
ncbi:MAG: flagellar basal body P-ring formation protein FlgA [Candidatus Gastranaerophilales bacterium]|nr:flagellar basal body P-ring formation protein FlgA [Candidatus Gastranaerophilales bacterium]